MSNTFGRRGPGTPQAVVRQAGPSFRLPPVSGLQLLQGAGFVLLGFVMGRVLLGTLAPRAEPEYYRYTYVPWSQRTDVKLIDEKTMKQINVPPGGQAP